jgi:hypothetical protein
MPVFVGIGKERAWTESESESTTTSMPTHALDIYWPMCMDVYGPVCNAFDAGNSITRASGGGWALEIKTFFLPCEMVSSRQANAI